MDLPLSGSTLKPLTLVTLLGLLILSYPEGRASGTSRIEIYIYGPVLAQVIDASGRRSGMDLATGQVLKDIPGTSIVKERTRERLPGWTIHFSDPVSGIYRIQVKGIDPGGFVIDVDAVDSRGRINNSNIFRRIKEGDILEFFFTYNLDQKVNEDPLKMSPN
jgi:hypothetical protein